MPTQAEVRLAALEEKQKGHEERVKMEIANFSQAIERAQETAQEAKDLATQVATSVESMPSKIIGAIQERQKNVRMEGKEWIMLVLVLSSPFAAAWATKLMGN